MPDPDPSPSVRGVKSPLGLCPVCLLMRVAVSRSRNEATLSGCPLSDAGLVVPGDPPILVGSRTVGFAQIGGGIVVDSEGEAKISVSVDSPWS